MKFKEALVIFLIFLSIIYFFNSVNVSADSSFPSNVSLKVFKVLRETFNGSTTVFDGLSEDQLRNLPGVILEKTAYGRVDFNDNLDMITMAGEDWIVDFDSDLNISNNLINVNEENLSGITKSANLTIKGLSYSDPVIKHNGADCTDCTLISYSGGILKFKVNSFNGVYYAVENPNLPVCGNGICEEGETSTNCPADCGGSSSSEGGGGGGGGASSPITSTEKSSEGTSTQTNLEGYDFFIDPNFLVVKMAKGTYYEKLINITNNGTKPLAISPSVVGVSDFIFPEVAAFALNPGESKVLRFDIYVSKEKRADVYVGKILFRSRYLTKEAKVILDVKEKNALFDIRAKVLKRYVNPGGRIRANISLINMGDLRNFDVTLEYKIIDFNKTVYSVKKETFAINQTYQNTFFLDVPEDIKVGNYLFYAKVSYGDVSASSYDTFVVEKVSYIAWIILVISIIVMIWLVIRWYRKEKYKMYKQLVGEPEKKKEKKKDLSKELYMRIPKLPE